MWKALVDQDLKKQPPMESSIHDRLYDLQQATFYLSEGKWTPEELRSIIKILEAILLEADDIQKEIRNEQT